MKKSLLLLLFILFSAVSFVKGSEIGDVFIRIFNGKRMTQAQLDAVYGNVPAGICTPAVKVGPRVYLSAAHCPSIQAPEGNRVIEKINKAEYFQDYDHNPGCVEAVQKYQENETLSINDVNICNSGMDLQIAVMENETVGPAVSIAASAPAIGTPVLAVGGCNGVSYGYFQTTGVTGGVASITALQPTNPIIQTCPGDSGGQYFQISANREIQLFAVHTMGVWNTNGVVIAGKNLKFPFYWHAGTNLNDPAVKAVLQDVINTHHVEICGINKACAPVTWLYQ